MSLYDDVGGAPTFEALVHAFYEGVATDPPLRALYPEDDLAPAERRLRMFLTQYFGGPATYSQERGHPRLRMRHAPYPVTVDMRDRWMRHMHAAMDTLDLPEVQAEQMRDYFLRAAHMLVNTDEQHPPLPPPDSVPAAQPAALPAAQPSPLTGADTAAEPATLTAPGEVVHEAESADAPWWRDAVIYQVYPRSWSDADGDGIGDLPGVTARLPYLRDLGVDAVWLSPVYVSPMNDAGYDVADYRDIDPRFGALADADTMIATAHALGLKVLLDLVPNHTSSDHAWFRAAVAAGPGSTERERYIFREGRGTNGQEPPNNWPSVFGGRGWTRVTEPDGTPGQWYLHIFDVTQPDLNWKHPDVVAEFHDILRFWCERGVDGFRVDVAHGLVKRDGLPDWHGRVGLYDEVDADTGPTGEGRDAQQLRSGDGAVLDHTATGAAPMWDQDGVHEIYRGWRSVLDSYGEPARILCAEAWVEPAHRLARYVRPDEMHQAFNFDFLDAHWDAAVLGAVIEASLRSNDDVGAPTTWVLSNHDVVRHASRLGLDQSRPRPNGIRAEDPQPDAALGLRRARAATALMLGLPGGAYVYQGEELGLPEHTSMPDSFRQDPTFHRTHGKVTGRDGCRVPMPWVKGAPSNGFGPGDHPWLPQPEVYGDLAVDQQEGVAGSTLELYRALLAHRRTHRVGQGALAWDSLSSDTVVALRNTAGDGERPLLVVTNFGPDPVVLPDGEVLVASGPLTDDGAVPTDTTVWVRLPVA